MRKVTFVALVSGLLLLASAGSASPQRAEVGVSRYRGLQLAILPSTATVYWRSRCTAGGSRFALGVRVFSNAQSAEVRFRAGKRTVDRNFNVPVGDTSWFRLSSARVQWAAAAAGGESGYTVGAVQVDFGSGGCGFYDPPRVAVQVYPRHPQGEVPPRGPGGILRPWPIK